MSGGTISTSLLTSVVWLMSTAGKLFGAKTSIDVVGEIVGRGSGISFDCHQNVANRPPRTSPIIKLAKTKMYKSAFAFLENRFR